MAELGPMGLTGAQARVIRFLEGVGHPVRMADIAAALEVVPRTATSIVDGLEAARLVVRAIDPHDRRSILVSLTDEGALLLDRLASARRRTAEATFSRAVANRARRAGAPAHGALRPCVRATRPVRARGRGAAGTTTSTRDR